VNPEIHLIAAASSRVFTPEKLIDSRDEESQMNPSDFYGKVKAKMRREIEKSRDSGLAFSTAILFNHYSTYSKGGYLGDVLASKVHAAIRDETLTISLNKPFARADLSHARDICSSIVNILDLKNSGDFLLGSGVAKTMKELVYEIGKLMNLEITLNMDSIQEYEPCVIADVTKAKSVGVASHESTYARAVVEKIGILEI
jgi:nucleoside-diphosphate-sugar epimerase